MPTTGSHELFCPKSISPKELAVGVRCECIVGVAEVGVG
jgi:hypothetical protein